MTHRKSTQMYVSAGKKNVDRFLSMKSLTPHAAYRPHVRLITENNPKKVNLMPSAILSRRVNSNKTHQITFLELMQQESPAVGLLSSMPSTKDHYIYCYKATQIRTKSVFSR